MKAVIRKIVNKFGVDIHEISNGAPRWGCTADDYYPLDVTPRWGHGRAPHPGIQQLLAAGLDDYESVLRSMSVIKPVLETIPDVSPSSSYPCWRNNWFSTLDAAALLYFIISKIPARYFEIGSGYSTRFARYAISSGGLRTTITSIDPNPRVDVSFACDEVIRKPLELVDLALFDAIAPGDIVFFDGSHRAFTNSDVTVFFVEVLPRLKPGVLVHIHDIFWPDDYPPEWNRRLYSEQYLLGAILLAGTDRFKIILPNYFVCRQPRTTGLVDELGIAKTYPNGTTPGVSFWIEMT